MSKYLIANASCWNCRSDATVGDYFCHNVILCDLDKNIPDKADFALLGFSCDVGVARNLGRRGAQLAPPIIRDFLSRLTIPFDQTIYDCGDILVEDNDSLLLAQQMLANYVSKIVHSGTTPIVLGGGHETAYGHYLGLLNAMNADIAILNFDAHFDLRALTINNNEGTSGTPFRQIYYECQQRGRKFDYYCVGIQPLANVRGLYQFAKETGTTFIEAHNANMTTVAQLMQTIMAKHKYVYVTVCLDVFHYSVAPGVSAPQALGIYPDIVIQAINLIRPKILALDIVEFNPNFDIDNHTARLAANLIAGFCYTK